MVSWRLTSGRQCAEILARGAALRTYEVDGRAIVDGFDADEVPPAFNGAVLAPWPNRLRDGAWSYTGARLQLPVNEIATGSALHGLVLWADWQPVSADSSSVTLRCRINAQPGYPFDVELEVQYSLIESGLRCDIAASNVGAEVAPFGCGAHPFFGGEGTAVDDMTLSVPARSWLATDERLLPARLCFTQRSAYDFLTPRSLAGVVLDNAFTDVNRDGLRRSTVGLQVGEESLQVWADREFGWWQVYTSDSFAPTNPRYRRAVAIEPMTCGPDAFNTGVDLIQLAPGTRWCSRWGIAVESLAANLGPTPTWPGVV